MAVYPPAEACDDLQRQLAALQVARAAERGVNTRMARRDTWHVTLAFLGEVPDGRVTDVETAVGRGITGGPEAGPPQLCLAGGGRFGRGRFTLLWVGVEGDRAALDRMSRQVRRELRRGRLPYDDRPFKPHVTIARPGDRLDRPIVDADRAALAGYRGPVWPVRRVELVRSHLGPRPRYDHLAAWSLG